MGNLGDAWWAGWRELAVLYCLGLARLLGLALLKLETPGPPLNGPDFVTLTC